MQDQHTVNDAGNATAMIGRRAVLAARCQSPPSPSHLPQLLLMKLHGRRTPTLSCTNSFKLTARQERKIVRSGKLLMSSMMTQSARQSA